MTQSAPSREVSSPQPVQQSRRNLLKMTVYIPPAILGVMLSGNNIAEAATLSCRPVGGGKKQPFTVSATSAQCCPCAPGSSNYNPTLCKCLSGICGSCVGLTLSRQDCKTAQAAGCTCNCGARPRTCQ